MRNFYLIAATLLLTIWACAQGTPPSGQQPTTQASSHAQAADKGQSIEGCLASSNGGFILTDKSGKTYQLASDSVKLDDHVGQTLRVWGSEQKVADHPGASSLAGAQPIFTVEKMKMISPSCSNSK